MGPHGTLSWKIWEDRERTNKKSDKEPPMLQETE